MPDQYEKVKADSVPCLVALGPEIPKSKSQIPNKFQNPKLKYQTMFGY